jgi:restriction system protein
LADAEMRKQLALARAGRALPSDETVHTSDEDLQDDPVATEGTASDGWRGTLLAALKEMPPSSFERLCAQLLREAGCEDVTVTRYVGDEGLDGVGVLRVGLLSFPVYFQAKRYGATVGPEKVRELRGALGLVL